jgi:uncharacterized protein Usg
MRPSSVAPLVLVVPFVAAVTCIVPALLQADSLLLTVWTVVWLACTTPSPQDFLMFWHAELAVAEHTAETSEE